MVIICLLNCINRCSKNVIKYSIDYGIKNYIRTPGEVIKPPPDTLIS